MVESRTENPTVVVRFYLKGVKMLIIGFFVLTL